MYNSYNEVSGASYNIGSNFVEIKTEYECDYTPHANVSILKLLQEQNDHAFVG